LEDAEEFDTKAQLRKIIIGEIIADLLHIHLETGTCMVWEAKTDEK